MMLSIMIIVFYQLCRQHHEDHCHFKLNTNSADTTIHTLGARTTHVRTAYFLRTSMDRFSSLLGLTSKP